MRLSRPSRERGRCDRRGRHVLRQLPGAHTGRRRAGAGGTLCERGRRAEMHGLRRGRANSPAGAGDGGAEVVRRVLIRRRNSDPRSSFPRKRKSQTSPVQPEQPVDGRLRRHDTVSSFEIRYQTNAAMDNFVPFETSPVNTIGIGIIPVQSRPPVIGRGAPVVPGKLNGSPAPPARRGSRSTAPPARHRPSRPSPPARPARAERDAQRRHDRRIVPAAAGDQPAQRRRREAAPPRPTRR